MLTILGGGGWFPAHDRQTACALFRDGDGAVMIDAGSGVGRLVERPELLDGINRLDIVLTHFHLDHIVGLAYLPAIAASAQTSVWGPGRLLYGIATDKLLEQLSHEPFNPVPLADQQIAVRDVPPGEFELGDFRIATRRQDRHSAPSLGLRFGDQLAWVTDTAYDPGSESFAAGCRLLAHEAWYTQAAPLTPEIHSSAAEAGQVASRAGVEQLLVIHLPPFTGKLDALLEEAKGGFPRVQPAYDGVQLPEIGG